MLGTPAFAPPEQVAGEIDKVDTHGRTCSSPGRSLAGSFSLSKPLAVGATFESVEAMPALRLTGSATASRGSTLPRSEPNWWRCA